MPDIKTRDTIKGTIKTIDKAAVAGERMKDAYVRTKDKAERSVYSSEGSPSEYAADRMTGTAEMTGVEAAHQFDKQGRKSFETTRENIAKGKEHWEQRKEEKRPRTFRNRKHPRRQSQKKSPRPLKPKSRSRLHLQKSRPRPQHPNRHPRNRPSATRRNRPKSKCRKRRLSVLLKPSSSRFAPSRPPSIAPRL